MQRSATGGAVAVGVRVVSLPFLVFALMFVLVLVFVLVLFLLLVFVVVMMMVMAMLAGVFGR